MDWKRKPKRQQETVAAKKTSAKCGPKPHRRSQRRVETDSSLADQRTLGCNGKPDAGTEERIALVAKDFQIQAQWALVAIPAPIYRWAA
jgi:hypothetical protein